MKRKKSNLEEVAEIPMSAMIDVVFLLLIYFIIIHKKSVAEAHITINSAINSSASKSEKEIERIRVKVFSNYYNWQGAILPLQQIEKEIIAQLTVTKSEDIFVDIFVAKDTKHQKLVNFVNICKKHKVEQFNVFTLDE